MNKKKGYIWAVKKNIESRKNNKIEKKIRKIIIKLNARHPK